MPKTKKCDRCGIRYEPYILTDEFRFKGAPITVAQTNNDGTDKKNVFDLCKLCREELAEFMNYYEE